MKKKIISRGIKILCLLLTVVLLSGLGMDLCRYYDYNVLKLAGFYAEPRNSLDVVLLGASEVFTDFSSGQAYDLYGFTSYPYALDAAPASLQESQLQEIRNRQNPKYIVVEINAFLYDDPTQHTNSGSLRRYLNNIPLSVNWAKTVWEVAPEEERYVYFYPLAKDHSNWKTISEQWPHVRDLYSIRLNGSLLKGNVTNLSTHDGPDHRDVSSNMTTAPLEPMGEAYLLSFLNYCREENIDNVIFVRFPHVIGTEESYERFCRGNEAERIIREYGFDFINLERQFEDIGLDAHADFYNEDHLNIYGQQKLTAYFSRILAEEYGVMETVLKDGQYRAWDQAALYSRKFISYAQYRMERNQHGALYENRELMETLKNWE